MKYDILRVILPVYGQIPLSIWQYIKRVPTQIYVNGTWVTIEPHIYLTNCNLI